MLIIHPESHLDHNLTLDHIKFILQKFKDRKEFFKEEVDLHDVGLNDLPSALWGPLAGDPPVEEEDEDLYYEVRGLRPGESRMVNRHTRPWRTMVVVAGPYDGHECVLFTAYGGPIGAPKEPWDCEEGSEEQREAKEFWSKHALAPE